MRRARVMLAGLSLGAMAMAMGGAAPAMAASAPPAIGHVQLFTNPDFTGSIGLISYTSCGGASSARVVGSFDNRPLPGCQVVLETVAGPYVLCAGSGVVPPAYRNAHTLSIRAGQSKPCFA